ncbi:YodC family protein [Vibrio diabolicus]|uniref:YodC family protein n=1 Tax=Vibrio diabolicus TaxID=50719 RepID=UPI0009B97F03
MFSIGDVVVLKSGSPLMTVGYIHGDDNISCQWFLDGEVKSHRFHPQALIKYEDQ